MAYQALYREYRPASFADVLGQDHIITILRNQLASGRVSHAYLFCGSRGTGKTTIAKIFARTVNCLSPTDSGPCFHCAACLESDKGAVDIIEFDAASNNGVDDMRSLIERAVFSPVTLKRKVYIIDEAHMLSKSAFDSLLKTLEEPPAHVMFILATTEPHKLPPTIISRCQRFDFKRISVDDMVKCIEGVLAKVGAKIERDGLLAIARSADGGMRDALSITDQCLSFCGTDVKKEDVYSVLGCMDSDFLFGFASLLACDDACGALRSLDDIVKSGRDLSVFASDLMSHMRALLFAKLIGSCADILDCTEDSMKQYLEQSKKFSSEKLERSMGILAECISKLRFFQTPRLLLDLTMVKLCHPEYESSLISLEERVSRLESAAQFMPDNAQKPGNHAHVQPSEPLAPAAISSAPSAENPYDTGMREPSAINEPSFYPDEPPFNIDEPPFDLDEPLKDRMDTTAPLQTNASLDDELIREFKRRTEQLGLLIKVSFCTADYSISNNILTASFDSKTHYRTAQSACDDADAVLKSISRELTLKLCFIEPEQKDFEEQAKSIFGNKLVIS